MKIIETTLKKALLATAIGVGSVGSAHAVFTALPANTAFKLEITGGCFDFTNCQVTGNGLISDNATANQASFSGYGSGIVGDGLMGVIRFHTDASGGISVTSYSQDSYLGTAGGTFYLQDQDDNASLMTGTVDGSGNMTLTPAGRDGIAASFAGTLGLQEWNRDNTSDGLGTGLYDTWSTGTSTNRQQGFSAPFTLTGTPLSDAGAGLWMGTLVVAGNIGQAWGSFDNQQYSELFNVTITQLNNPVAVNDTASTTQGQIVTIDVLSNDNDPNGDIDSTSLQVIDVSGLAAGSTAVVNAGQINYTPAASFLGTESFTYQVDDLAANQSNFATVTVTVSSAGNVPPVANDDGLSTDEDTSGMVDVLANDTDSNAGDTLTITGNTSPTRGTVVNNGDGTFTYTPNANLNGADSFTYTISDGNGGSDTAIVSVTVNPVNDDPVAGADTVVVQLDTALDISVLSNDSDVDSSDVLSIQSFTQGAHGAVTDNGNGTLKYTPDTSYTGADQFTYTIGDGNGGSAVGTVNISVISIAYSGGVAADLPGAQISPDVTGGSNFTMLNPDGSDIGGTNDLSVSWSGDIYTDAATQTAANMQIATSTPTPFFGFVWEATTVRVFGPGTYTFDTCPGVLTNSGGVLGYIASDGSTNCDPSGNNDLSMTVGPNQLGAHMLFNWNRSSKIDVAMVWDINAAWAGAPDGSNNFAAKGAVFTLSVVDADGDGKPGAPMVDGPFNGFSANFNLNLNPTFALPVVNMSIRQAGDTTSIVVPGGGNVTVTANVGAGTYSYDWSGSDAALTASNPTSNSTLVFDPSGLSNGVYTASVTITDTSSNLQNSDTITLRVDSTPNPDSDGDGIPDASDGTAALTKLQGQAGNSVSYVLEASAGKLILGDMALNKGVQTGIYGATLEAGDFSVLDSAVTDSCIGGCFDFEVEGVAIGGAVDVVLPLSQAIPANAIYRKFINSQWLSFRGTGTAPGAAVGGELASAPGSPGLCPAPSSGDYTAGLTEGHFCVRLTIHDGGLNDADGTANGRIKDPGGIGGAAADELVVSSVPSPDVGGGCAMSHVPQKPVNRIDIAMLIAFLGWLAFIVRVRREVR